MIATAAMDEAGRSAWCREQGVFPSELEKWRNSATAALAAPEEARATAQQTRADQLSLSHGAANENLFADESIRIEVDLPRNGDLVASEDVDDDGRADLVMRYTAADGEQAAHIVRLLIASQ